MNDVLTRAYRTVARVSNVRALQESLEVKVDGIYGPKTRAAHLATLDALWAGTCMERGWIYTGTAVPMAGLPRKSQPDALAHLQRVVLHWPVSPDSGALALDAHWARNRARGVATCSHASIDEKVVVWHCGPHRVAHHAPGANATSIGVDIAVPVLAERADAARTRGLYVGTTGRRNDLLQLSPIVASATAVFLNALGRALGTNLPITDHAAVDWMDPNGPRGKIDCVVWRDALRSAGINIHE